VTGHTLRGPSHRLVHFLVNIFVIVGLCVINYVEIVSLKGITEISVTCRIFDDQRR